MSTASEFRTKLLSRRTGQDDYKVYRAGLEWDLTDPIVIESAEDFKSSTALGRSADSLPSPSQQSDYFLPPTACNTAGG